MAGESQRHSTGASGGLARCCGERVVDLPPGSWFRFASNQHHAGLANLPLPIDEIGLLARAGAILPTDEAGELVLQVYRPDAGSVGAGVLYTDAGDGFGEGCIDEWRLESTGAGYELGWHSQGTRATSSVSPRVRLFGFDGDAVHFRGEPLAEGQVLSI